MKYVLQQQFLYCFTWNNNQFLILNIFFLFLQTFLLINKISIYLFPSFWRSLLAWSRIVPNHWSTVHSLEFILVIYRTRRLILYLMMSHNVMYPLSSVQNTLKIIDKWDLQKMLALKVGLLPFKKSFFICFNDIPSKMMKNAFYFILKAFFVLKIFQFLSWLFGHVEKTDWLER